MKNYIIIGGVIVIGVLLFGFFYKEKHEEVSHVHSVTVADVNSVDAEYVHTFGATVESADEAVLSAEISGNIKEILVDEGDVVKKGQLLASISAPSYSAQYVQAQTMLDIAIKQEELARRKWDDYKPEEREQIKLEVSHANAARAEAAAYLTKSRIVAPFDGVVSTKFVTDGKTVSQGESVIRVIGDVQKKEIGISVVSEIFGHISVGDSIKISKEGMDGTAIVYAIDPVTDARTRKLGIRATIDEPNKYDVGDFIDVHITSNSISDGVLVPVDSLVRFYDDMIVFVLEGDVVHSALVHVQYIDEGDAVVSGIDVGNRVVVSGAHDLEDGEKVDVIDEK